LAPQAKSDAINQIANERGVSFLEAVQIFNDNEVNEGIEAKATELNDLVHEIFRSLPDGERALVVSHDLSISPAMAQKGISLASIDPLCGYAIFDDGTIQILR